MKYELVTLGEGAAVERKSPLSSIEDAMDLVSACAQNATDRLLLDAAVLPGSFYDLRTRFAGELLQKLQNHRLRTAVVVRADGGYSERFKAYLAEAERARHSRILTSREQALAWLSQA